MQRRDDYMSLFDDVTVRYPLPDPDMQDAAFQTKDLLNTLTQFTITEEGRLLAGDREMDYHGDIAIYAFHPARPGLMTYHVRFTHGLVESITRDESRLR
jgi:hypothetical protein